MMQMIQDALSPERLAQFRKMFDAPAEPEDLSKERAEKLDARLRAQRDAHAEAVERRQHESREVSKVGR